jgi:hypothetical protein
VKEHASNVEERLARVLPFVREAPWEEDIDLSIQTGGEPRGHARIAGLRSLEAVRAVGMQEELLALEAMLESMGPAQLRLLLDRVLAIESAY